MYREPLGPGLEAGACALLEQGLPPSEFREATLDWLRRHYRPDATVAGGLRGRAGRAGGAGRDLVLDSSHPAVKRAAARSCYGPWKKRRGSTTTSTATPRAQGVTSRDLRDRGRRRRVARHARGRRRGATGWSPTTAGSSPGAGGSGWTLEELRRIAAEAPTRLSPNVLLRPVVESALLPTVAYLAGPGELRYFELTPPVYERLGVPRQLPMPRWSGLLVEPRVDRVLEKFGIEPRGPARAGRCAGGPAGALAVADRGGRGAGASCGRRSRRVRHARPGRGGDRPHAGAPGAERPPSVAHRGRRISRRSWSSI